MKGFVFRTAAVSFVVVSTAILPTQLFAVSAIPDSNKTTMLGSKLGCMACHQGGSAQSDDHEAKKNPEVKPKPKA